MHVSFLDCSHEHTDFSRVLGFELRLEYPFERMRSGSSFHLVDSSVQDKYSPFEHLICRLAPIPRCCEEGLRFTGADLLAMGPVT